MKVVLHIDRLVLRGVAADQRDAVVASLQAALTRHLAMPGVAERLTASGHRDRVRARFAAGPGPETLGRVAAQHVAGAVLP